MSTDYYYEKHFVDPDFFQLVRQGLVPGHSLVSKFGAAEAIGTSITPVATAKTYKTPTALTSLELVSDSTDDAAAGSGLRKVRVYGLSTGWEEVIEEVTLNGTTAVALANQYFRIYRMYGTESGTYATDTAPSHNSTITLRVASGGATWAEFISVGGFGMGQSEIACYSVPAGYKAYLVDRYLTVETNKAANLFGFIRESADTVAAPFSPMRVFERNLAITEEHAVKPRVLRGPFQGPCDLGYMAAATPSGTCDVSISFDLLLVATS